LNAVGASVDIAAGPAPFATERTDLFVLVVLAVLAVLAVIAALSLGDCPT
jgi:hypothetical protein